MKRLTFTMLASVALTFAVVAVGRNAHVIYTEVTPSASPSSEPSETPTNSPSPEPSSSPSVEPSVEPSNEPSIEPSPEPSATSAPDPTLPPTSTEAQPDAIAPGLVGFYIFAAIAVLIIGYLLHWSYRR